MKLNILPAKNGRLWIKDAIKIIRKKPSFFVSSALLYLLMIMGVALLSSGLPLMLQPIPIAMLSVYFGAAIMLGCDFISHSNQKEVYYETSLLSRSWGTVFKNRNLLILAIITGIIFSVIYFAVYLIFSSIYASTFTAFALFIDVLQKAPEAPIPSEAYSVMLSYSAIMQVIGGITNAATFILFCMTPAIVFWQKTPPAKAVFYNAYACLKNWRAWLVWGLVLALIFIGFSFVLGLILGLLGVASQGAPSVAFIFVAIVISLILLIVTLSLFPTCYYLAYKDSFAPVQQDNPMNNNDNAPSNPFETF